MRTLRRRWRVAAAALIVVFALGTTAVWTNTLGAGDRFDRMMARIGAIIHPPPNRPTLPTLVFTPQPIPTATPVVVVDPPSRPPRASATPRPTPTPPVRAPVDVRIVKNHKAVFASELTTEWCAVAGTQMVLAILGKGDTSDAFQNEVASRIGEWESWADSHNGGWGPAAIALALKAYGVGGYEVRAYDRRADALRDSAIALSETGKPVVLLPWWGAHTWVMTGYRADADPTIFRNATITGTYILDPWYPRISSIWGPSDPPGTFQDAAEMERNFIGWSRPEGAYPNRDGRYVVVVPTTPLPAGELRLYR
jgi:hypothetical protein